MTARLIFIISLFICIEASAQPVVPVAAADWQQTVAAAKKEGAVVISALPGELRRQVFMEFERDYPGIKVSYHSGSSRDFWPRLKKEREVGHYLWDLHVSGVSPAAYQARDRGALDPIKPLLLLPEVADDAKWLGGIDGLFADKDKKYVLRYMGLLFGGVAVDRDAVPAADFTSPQELLDPRWRGRIVMQDPRGGGAGSHALAGFLRQYGEDFVRRLLSRQNVAVSDSKRQMAEWVIRKRYPIAIGMGTDILLQFRQEGLGKNIKVVLGDGTSGDAVTLINKAPHPNAAKVYVNWLLSQKTQNRLAQIAQLNSRRADVKPGNPELALDPKRMQHYFDISDEQNLDAHLKTSRLVKELLK